MTKRRVQRKAGIWPLLGLCLINAGCLSYDGVSGQASYSSRIEPIAVAAPSQHMAAGTVVLWTVEAVQNGNKHVTTGKSVVGADGFLKLGPLGSVQAAGLSPDQVRTAMQSHLAQSMPQPRVSLDVLTGAAGASAPVAAANPAGRVWGGRAAPAAQLMETARLVPQPSGIVPVVHRSPAVSPEPVPQVLPPALPVEPPPRLEPLTFQMDDAPKKLPEQTMPEESPAPKAQPVAELTIGDPGCAGGPMGAPHELAKTPMPPYVIDIPDILLVESTQGLRDQPISGQHIIRPDGTVNLGIYGSAYVAGMTLEEARVSIAAVLGRRIKEFKIENLNVDVLAYNSKWFYVVTDGGGYGEQVYRFPYTGNETVLDALAQINGIPAVGSKRHIWVARRGSCDTAPCQVLPVDWKGVVQKGCTNTNYQLYPGDRIYVKADPIIWVDTLLAKWISPVERLFGVTLLGASTVQTIQAANAGGNNNGNNNNFGGGGGNNGFNNTFGLFGLFGRVPAP